MERCRSITFRRRRTSCCANFSIVKGGSKAPPLLQFRETRDLWICISKECLVFGMLVACFHWSPTEVASRADETGRCRKLSELPELQCPTCHQLGARGMVESPTQTRTDSAAIFTSNIPNPLVTNPSAGAGDPPWFIEEKLCQSPDSLPHNSSLGSNAVQVPTATRGDNARP